jgi:hypothetical protein
MGALMSLEPRDAGTDVLEPVAEFAEQADYLHGGGKCSYTLGCVHDSQWCTVTG